MDVVGLEVIEDTIISTIDELEAVATATELEAVASLAAIANR